MSKKLKKKLRRIIIASCLFLVVKLVDYILSKVYIEGGLANLIPNFNYGFIIPFILYFSIYIYIGYDVIKGAFKNIINGNLLDENFLMVVATFGAFGLGIYTGILSNNPEGFDEGCAVLLFFQLGEWFQAYAVGGVRKSISSLMDIRPDYANLIANDKVDVVSPDEVHIDNIILVKPGEKIPLDGIVIEGSSFIDSKALTGESLPIEIKENDNILSGSINLSNAIKVKVTKEFYDSTVSKILELVENATNNKSKSEEFITKFARFYTPIVVFLALALAIIPPILFGIINSDWSTWSTWIYRALSFLVVSCPCALVISIPLTFFSGIGGASKQGILIKGSSYLEKFNQASIFVFDKTGTLTKGGFEVIKVYPEDKKDYILELANIAESNSNHPIATSIKKAYQKEINSDYQLEDIPGKGIKATNSDNIILCGNEKLLEDNNIEIVISDDIGTIVYVAKNNKFEGYLVIADTIKEDAKETISYLNSIGSKTIMLTGDNNLTANKVANDLEIKEYKASLLPIDKVNEVDNLLKNKKENDCLCFVGDGINDAPVLVSSDIGIAMGGIGSDAAIEASDIVLMHDDLKSIIKAKKIVKKTMVIVKENIYFAIGVKVAILILSAFGLTNMWLAVFGDVGVAIIAILNATRASNKRP